MRTRAFKEWFGDWEKAARIEKLRQASSVELKGYSGQYELTRDSARKWIKSNLEGKSYVIADTGETVRIGKAGRNKVTSHGYGNEAHMKSIADIPAMLENATFITEELAEKKDSKYPSYRYYVVGANIGETDYTVKIALGVAYDGTLYYDHSLTQIEKGALINLALAEQRRTQDFENALTGIKDNKLLSVLQVNSSKIVDENGEPLVVYHGTDADFTVFDRAKTRATMDIQGNFFSPWEDDARGYGSNVRRFFLNLRNPADENTGYHSLHEFEGQNGAGVKARERLVALGYDGVNNGGEEFIAFSPEQIKSATENVGTFDAGNPDIRYSLGGGASAIRAWHGSPHAFAAEEGAPFGRFGLSFVGTGEGAQAFGYGIYLSGKRGVAHGYAETLGDAKKAGRRILSDNYTRAFLKKHGLDVLDENPQHPLKDIFLIAFYVDQVKGRIEKYKTYYIGNSAVVGILKKLSPTKEMLDEYHVARMADFMSSKSSTITALDYLKSYKNGLDEYYQDGKQYLQLFKTTRQEQKAAKQAKENKELKQRIDEADDLYQRAKKLFDSEESAKKKYHHLYSVDISVAEDESNLLDWKGKLSKEQTSRIMSGMKARGVGDYWVGGVKHLSYSFKGVYKQLSMALGGDKAASLFLKELGFIGHKYPVGSFRNKFNDYDAGTNYVIYDTGATEITDAVRWLRNDSGVVYGYWDEGRGELHLNEDFADFDTPLHEWAHVWLSWVRKADARLAERALAATKETKFYKRLREDKGSAYAGLSDDALAEEAFAMLCGKDGGVPVLRVSSVAFDFAENFLQAANRGEGIVVPADGAHDGKVPRAGAEHGGQPRFVDPADGDGGTRRGVDHRAHGLLAQRRIGNFLGRRGVDGADADVVGSGGTRGSRLRERMRGEPENFQRREAFPCGGQRHVVLPEMHAVGLRFRGDFRIVVHDEERARSRSDAANVFRGFDDAFPRRALHAQLNETQACAHGCVRAGFITRRGIRDDEVKAEGIFHKEKKKNAGARGLRAASHGVPAVVVFQRFKSSAMMRASLRPLLSMPPKIGPMRKPPCTLFAAMPEA